MLSSQYQRLVALRNLSYEPRAILDIGAHKGEWATLARSVFPSTPICMVEAQSHHEGELLLTGNPYCITLLSDKGGDVKPFYTIAGCDTGASMYCENTKYYNSSTVIEKQLTTRTLDDVTSRHFSPHEFDFIKIDVQGAELDVLRGGEDTLKSAMFVLLEMPVAEYNKGAPSFAEVVAFMDEKGFQVYDAFEAHYHGVHLIQMDFLFARKNCPFIHLRQQALHV